MENFEPYMEKLTRKIKSNWYPPNDNKSEKIIVAFTLNKDGNLLGVEIAKSSGTREADRAAMTAVKSSAPFAPLPPDTQYSCLNVRFTFDYKVMQETPY